MPSLVGFWSTRENGGLLIQPGGGSNEAETFGQVRTYQVSQFPNNLTISTGCQGSDFEPARLCSGISAYRGWFKVTEVSPTYRATFHLEDLWRSPFGPPIPGVIEGCIAAPNPPPGSEVQPSAARPLRQRQ
jgi:hypothetical protein